MLSIEAIRYFIPEGRLDVERDRDHFNLTREQSMVFSRIYGLKEIPIAREMGLVEFIQSPVESLIRETGIDKKSIKYLIHAHTSKVITRFGHSVVRAVKQNLGLSNAMAFGTSLNNCASTLNAFEMAGVLLADDTTDARAIVISGEMAFTPSVQVIPNTSITGDAAAAALISHGGEKNRLLHLEMYTNGSFSRGIWMDSLEARAFETAYSPTLSRVILNAVSKANLVLDDIKAILPHNVNLISWNKIAKELNFDPRKIYLSNVKKYAHCFGSDIMINYVNAVEEGLIQAGDYYIMATVGLGATFAAAVFRF
jgi:3-oxoacyl-[acyl-carrier-protein] synthase-3